MTEHSRNPGQRHAAAAPRAFGAGHGAGAKPRSLRLLVESLVAEAVSREPGAVSVTLDIPHTLRVEGDDATLRRLFLPLLERSIDATLQEHPRGDRPGDVLVTAVEVPGAIEIEFADSGSGLEQSDLVALAPRESDRPAVWPDAALASVARIARAAGGRLTAINCPDGGAALTIRLPTHGASAMRRAA